MDLKALSQMDPKLLQAAGIDPNLLSKMLDPKALGGMDAKMLASMGMDPKMLAGMDPNMLKSMGIDPKSAGMGGAGMGGMDAKLLASMGLDPKMLAGMDPNMLKSMGIDPKMLGLDSKSQQQAQTSMNDQLWKSMGLDPKMLAGMDPKMLGFDPKMLAGLDPKLLSLVLVPTLAAASRGRRQRHALFGALAHLLYGLGIPASAGPQLAVVLEAATAHQLVASAGLEADVPVLFDVLLRRLVRHMHQLHAVAHAQQLVDERLDTGGVVVPPASVHVGTVLERDDRRSLVLSRVERVVDVGDGVGASHGLSGFGMRARLES